MSICGAKFRIYPTKAQAITLGRWIGCFRHIYNQKVREDRAQYQRYKETGEKSAVNQTYAQFKTNDKPWLKEVPSQILRNSAVNWFQAKLRFFKGVAKNPRTKNRDTKASVLLTKEVFSLKQKKSELGEVYKELSIGTKRFPVGVIKTIFHKECGEPKQIVISKKNNCWFVSFCYQTNDVIFSDEELHEKYSKFNETELNAITVGIDRGVAIPFQISNATDFDFNDATKAGLEKKVKRLKRYQRKMSRQALTSNSRKRTKKKINKMHTKIANIRNDFCHKTSHKLATSEALIFSVEDLSIRNMTRSPKPKLGEDGRYLPNNRAAKAGLNRALLDKGLARTIELLNYKARNRGKCVIYVSPYYSSQECAECGHIHSDNRQSQAVFLCLSCGNEDNADLNAAKVIAKRGVKYLLSYQDAKLQTRLGISQSHAGRGISKTIGVSVAPAQVPMIPEARTL